MPCGQKRLVFFDVKAKKKFETDNWKEVSKKGRKFAVASSPYSDVSAWRILGKSQ